MDKRGSENGKSTRYPTGISTLITLQIAGRAGTEWVFGFAKPPEAKELMGSVGRAFACNVETDCSKYRVHCRPWKEVQFQVPDLAVPHAGDEW